MIGYSIQNTLGDCLMKEDKTQPKTELVVQHNKLIESKSRLTLQEKRVILWLLSQIKPTDNDFTSHRISIKEFCTITQVSPNGMYTELQKVTKRLIGRVLSIRDLSKNRTLQVSWLNVADYWHNEGIIELKIAQELRPYLLELREEFTVIKIPDIMGLSSIYAVRIFELLKQYQNLGKREIELNDLRKFCSIEGNKYKLYGIFKLKVLEIARREINAKTDIFIDYKEIKTARKITSINFLIKQNPNYKTTEFEKSQIEKAVIIQKELRSGNAIIQELLEFGFTLPHSRRIVKSNDHETLVNAIKALNIQVERGKARNPKAMLIKAIQEKWHPEKFVDRKPKAS